MRMINKFKIIIVVAALLIPALGWSIDAPHSNTLGYDVQCGSCHWTNSSATPPWTSIPFSPDPADDTINNRRCWVCHTGGTATAVLTHSTASTSSLKWAGTGWTTECVTCHDPHQQRQTRAWTVAATQLATGAKPTLGTYDAGNNWTPINVSPALPALPNYNGYYFMPDKNYPLFYEIVSDTSNAATINVKGVVNPVYIRTGGYAIVYGKNVKELISYTNPGGTPVGGSVKLFRPKGTNGPVDPDIPANMATSVCYVCHTQTNHFNRTGSGDLTHNITGDCATCHVHMAGFKGAGCDGCHGYPPNSAATMAYGSAKGNDPLKQTGNTSPGAHAAHVTKGLACANCHQAGMLSNVVEDKVIQIGFKLGTVDFTSAQHTPVLGSYINGYSVGGANGLGTEAAGDCSNMYCHSQGGSTTTPFGGAPNITATWGGSMPADCTGCHGGNASATGPKISTGAHTTHMNDGTIMSNKACNVCHNVTADGTDRAIATPTTHVNAAKNVDIMNTYDSDSTPGNNYSAGSCSNVYCHSTGEASPTYKTIAWGASITNCEGCHNYDAAATNKMSTGKHTQHMDNVAVLGSNYGCQECHNSTTTNGTSITTPANHVNKTRDVSMVKGGTWTSPNCTSAYCHSSGKGTYVNPPAWNSASTLTCAGCHGTTSTPVAGAPDYISGGAGAADANSHPKHVTTAADCNTCHTNTTTNGTAIKAGSTLHTNNAINVSFDTAKAGAGATYTEGGGTPKSCSTTYCHGAGTPQWGGTLADATECDSCHGGNAASTATPGLGPMTLPNHPDHMNNAAVLGTNYECAQCHNTTVSAGNDRLITGTVHADGTKNVSMALGGSWNGTDTCTSVYCHSSGKGTYENPPAWNSATNLTCAGCHGKTSAVAGTPDYISGGAGAATANSHPKHVTAAADCNTCHTNTTTNGTAIKAGSTLHTNNAINVSFDTAKAGVGATYTEGGGTPKSCSSISCHGAGTPQWGGASLACDSCHLANNTLAGKHGKHYGVATVALTTDRTASNTSTGTTYEFSCGVCHNSTPHADGNVSGIQAAQVAFDGTIAGGGTYTADTGLAGTDTGGRQWTSGTCATTYCHSQGQSTTTPFGGAGNTTAQWNGAAMTCKGCHNYDVASGSPMISSGHQDHVNSIRMSNAACSACHTSTTSDGTTITNTANHVNKAKDVAIDSQWDSDGTPTNNWDGTQCTNVYCHSDGQAQPGSYKTIVWANNAGNLGCSSCHGGASSLFSNAHGSHLYPNSRGPYTGLPIHCGACHIVTAADGTAIVNKDNHVNKLINIRFDNLIRPIVLDGDAPKYNGSSTTGSGMTKAPGSAIGSCENVYCHSVGNLADNTGTGAVVAVGSPSASFRTIAWDGGAIGCNGCHGDTADVNKAHPVYDNGGVGTTTANSHVKHVVSSSYSCDYCHNTTTTNTTIPPTTVLDNLNEGGQHLNRKEDVSFKTNGGKTGTYDATVGTKSCSTTYCHGTGTPQWGGTMDCTSCHDARNTGLSTRHDKHFNSTTAATVLAGGTNGHTATEYVYACLNCHPTDQHAKGPASGVQDAAIGGTNISAGNYTAAGTNLVDGKGFKYTNYGACSTVCHTKDGSTLGSGIVAAPAWDGSNSLGCGYCHSKPADVVRTWSTPHDKHLVTYAANTNFTCNACHAGTASDNNTINGLAGRDQHPDGSKNVAFNATVGGSWSGTQCSNTYCHSQGTVLSGSSTHSAINWSGSMTCGSCHTGGTTTGPTYASGSPKANSHALHTAAGKDYVCVDCHNATVDSSNTIISYTNHVNKTYNVAGSRVTYTYNATGGTCATQCHGSGTPKWGSNTATATCEKCHGSASTAPFNDTAGNTANTNAQVGAHRAHLGATHGYSDPIACSECHSVPAGVNSPDHIDSILPAEVPLAGTLANTNVRGVAGSPGYASSNCSNVYCHDYTRFKKGWADDATNPSANRTPTWNVPILSGNQADCQACHGFPPALPHPQNSNCVSCHNHVNGTNDGFTLAGKSLHVNGVIDGGGDNCSDCHSSAGGATAGTTPDAYHARHVVTAFVGKISTNDYGNYATNTWYAYSNTGGQPNMGCGFCHPQSEASHINGVIDLNFNPADTGATGTLKAKNHTTQTYAQTERTSVTCSSAYCHSTGYDGGSGYGYQTSMDWYASQAAIDAVDKCALCHGNSPNTGGKTGSSAHGAHVVGIHYKDVYSGTTGKLSQGAATNAAHGNAASATTINCNVCHNATVTAGRNKLNTVCNSCHTGGAEVLMTISVTSTSHVNGSVDVDFGSFSVKSKAQLRDDISTVAELNSGWTRSAGGYKNATADNSYDSSKRTPAYTSAGKTCSTVDCHNGRDVSWTATNVSCKSCHKGLPK